MKIIIRSQKEFDNIPKKLKEFTNIYIQSSEIIYINRNWDNSHVEARENSHVEAWDNSHVIARNNSHVEARENSHVEARDNSHVEARNNSHIIARDNSHVIAWDNSHIIARDNSHVEARENSHVEAWDNSHVIARNNSHVIARENSYVIARENSYVIARENSYVIARENSHVEARNNSHIIAWDSSNVFILSSYSTVFLFSFAVAIVKDILFNKKNIKKKSETTHVQIIKDQNFYERHGINLRKNQKYITLYKRVSKDFKTQENTKNETIWKIGSTLIHKNWNPKTDECGEGKFHAVAKPYFADEFRDKKEDKYIAIKIELIDLYEWKNPFYPHKIAFRKGKILYECDRYGEKL